MASRGGRGGRGGRTKQLPFDIDPELQDAADSEENSDSAAGPYPVMDMLDFFARKEPTAAEKREVEIRREMREKQRAGPYWTGTKDDWAKIDAEKKRDFDMFNGAETYGNKTRKKPFALADFRKVKAMSNNPEFFSKELQYLVRDDADPSGSKKGVAAKNRKSTQDKLAEIGDEAEGEEGKNDENDESEVDDDDEDDDLRRENHDDTFEEDEEDGDDDYNAENYFDGGEDDEGEERGGDEYGDDGY